jgi:hypothetical protein
MPMSDATRYLNPDQTFIAGFIEFLTVVGQKEIDAGNFRMDLYHRLSVILIHVPHLTERRDDIPLIAKSFCEEIKAMSRSEALEIARILRKHKIAVSENRSGIFFDMLKLPEEVFEELLTFREFVQKNNAELEKRQEELTA